MERPELRASGSGGNVDEVVLVGGERGDLAAVDRYSTTPRGCVAVEDVTSPADPRGLRLDEPQHELGRNDGVGRIAIAKQHLARGLRGHGVRRGHSEVLGSDLLHTAAEAGADLGRDTDVAHARLAGGLLADDMAGDTASGLTVGDLECANLRRLGSRRGDRRTGGQRQARSGNRNEEGT